MSEADRKAEGLRQAMERMVSTLDKGHLRTMQKESYMCMAKCCDTAASTKDLQKCCTDCERKVHVAEQAVQVSMNDFQERLQRCIQRCQDKAQETLSPQPTEKEIAKAQAQLANCAADCAVEYEKLIPKLQANIVDRFKQIKKG